MQCENEFCIYWTEGACRLRSVSPDLRGQCTDCVYVDMDAAALRQARERLLRRYDAR